MSRRSIDFSMTYTEDEIEIDEVFTCSPEKRVALTPKHSNDRFQSFRWSRFKDFLLCCRSILFFLAKSVVIVLHNDRYLSKELFLFVYTIIARFFFFIDYSLRLPNETNRFERLFIDLCRYFWEILLHRLWAEIFFYRWRASGTNWDSILK